MLIIWSVWSNSTTKFFPCLSLGAINKNLKYQAHIIHKTTVFSENEKSSSRFQGEEETTEYEFIHSFLVKKYAVFVIQIIVNHKSDTQEISAVSMELLVYLSTEDLKVHFGIEYEISPYGQASTIKMIKPVIESYHYY